jgi:hypothetical protein
MNSCCTLKYPAAYQFEQRQVTTERPMTFTILELDTKNRDTNEMILQV